MPTYHVNDPSSPVESLTAQTGWPYLICQFRPESLPKSVFDREEANHYIATHWLNGDLYELCFQHEIEGNVEGEGVEGSFFARIKLKKDSSYQWIAAYTVPMVLDALHQVLPKNEKDDMRYVLLSDKKRQYALNINLKQCDDPLIKDLDVSLAKNATSFTLFLKAPPAQEWLGKLRSAMNGLATVNGRGRQVTIVTLKGVSPYRVLESLGEQKLISERLYNTLDDYDLRIPNDLRDDVLSIAMKASSGGRARKVLQAMAAGR